MLKKLEAWLSYSSGTNEELKARGDLLDAAGLPTKHTGDGEVEMTEVLRVDDDEDDAIDIDAIDPDVLTVKVVKREEVEGTVASTPAPAATPALAGGKSSKSNTSTKLGAATAAAVAAATAKAVKREEAEETVASTPAPAAAALVMQQRLLVLVQHASNVGAVQVCESS